MKHKGKRASGGVGVYIRDDIATTAEKTLTFSNGFADGLVVTVKSIGLEIIVIYRSEPEDRSTADTTFSPLLTKIRSYLNALPSPTPDIILLGDPNLPNAIWDSGDALPHASTVEKKMINDLFSLASDFFLVQQIDAPTHCKGNQLDVVFTNNCHLVVHTEISPCPRSDHFLIDNYVASNSPRALVSSDEPPPPPEGFWKLNFFDEKVDWQSLTDALRRTPME